MGASTNIHDSPASLVGRVVERAAIAACFEDGARLVTLLGPGGVGKTRVAVRFAAEHADEYAGHGSGGVWLCDLTDARSATAICAVVATALGLALDRDTSEPQVVAVLGAALARRKRILLVIDTCEHVVAEVGATITTWMQLAPRARFLATSRIALGLPGEQLWPLAGLDVPAPAASLEAVRAAGAVDLFIRRARQVRPALPLEPADLAAIAEIVRRLDGMPLAIELAAARTRALSASQIRDRLSQPLELLVRPGDAGRHASMRSTIEDSVALLDDRARSVFAGCAIFRGGFSLSAAEAVLVAPGRDVLGLLETLCEHSLLRMEVGDHDGEPRFQLYATIYEVAAELLTGEPRAQLARRHAAHYAALGRELADRGRIAGDTAAIAHLATDLENLVDAHRHAVATDPALALQLALALEPVVVTRGLFRLRLRVLEQAIAASQATAEPHYAAALLARGHAHGELGALERARPDLDRGLALARQIGDPILEAFAEVRLGELVETTGATDTARQHFERALGRILAAPPGRLQRLRQAEIHARLGHALRREGDLSAADAMNALALEGYRAIGDPEGIAAMSYEAGVSALFRRHYDHARTWFDDGLALAQRAGARQLEAALTSGLGILLQEQGSLDEAIAHHAIAVQVFRDLGNRHREASALYYLGGAYLERGEPADALLDQAGALARGVGASRYEALIEGARGAGHAMRGHREAAELAFAAADRAAESCRSEVTLVLTLAIHRLHLELGASDVLARAAGLVEQHAGDDPRFALRLLAVSLRGAATPTAAALVIRADAAAFRLPGHATDVDLSRRLPLRRLLAALARRRVEAPGETLGLDDLLAAGWPDESIGHEAAVNRVHVALTTLRKLGLRGVLVSGERGYLLSPAVPVVLE